jgi:hypothetical protein
MPTISIDYDGTFTLDPEAWTKAIDIFRRAGFRVICITSRFPNVPIGPFPGEVFYACGAHKWDFAHENGIEVDVWVDDWPAQVGEHPERRGHEWGQLTQRRQMISQIFKNVRFS